MLFKDISYKLVCRKIKQVYIPTTAIDPFDMRFITESRFTQNWTKWFACITFNENHTRKGFPTSDLYA